MAGANSRQLRTHELGLTPQADAKLCRAAERLGMSVEELMVAVFEGATDQEIERFNAAAARRNRREFGAEGD